MSFKKIVCVYRTGGDFDAEYVRRLKECVEKHTRGFEFLCLTNDKEFLSSEDYTCSLIFDWPRWWSKMELFRPDLDWKGDFLYFDLDTIICGDMMHMVEKMNDRVILLRGFWRPGILNSGVMYLPENKRKLAWDKWIASPERVMEDCGSYGDQKFIGEIFENEADTWQDLFPDEFVSYKTHCLQDKPLKAKVICYHGKPRPKDTDWAIGGASTYYKGSQNHLRNVRNKRLTRPKKSVK